MKISELVEFNPKRPLKKGEVASFVEMSSVPENGRDINKIDSKTYTGSGSKFRNRDILFARITPCLENGKTCLVSGLSDDEIAFGSTEFIVMAAKNESRDTNYLYYLTRLPEFRLYAQSQMNGSSGRQRVSWQSLSNFEYDFPSSNVRYEVGEFLKKIDDKIEINIKINKTLEQMSQTLFKSWFVDFDPVIDNALDAGNPIPEALQSRAELRQKVCNSTDFKPLPAEIRSLFPSEFEETELGWVPKGWSIVRTEDIALKIGMGPFGSNIKVSTFVNAGVPIISGQHLKDPLLIDGDNNFITPEHAEKLKNSAVYRKDIIFTHAGNIGQVSLIPEDSENDRYIISQRQFFLRVNESKSSPNYLIHYFRSEKGQHALLSNASQVGVPSIARPSTHLKNISFLNPPMVLLKEFEKFSTPLFHRFSKNRKCGVSLTALRDTLLPKLISGELSLDDLPDLTTDTEAA
ncbi:restriction endonuclease subunit S [Escherichia coli]|nr:restriction endonuclease subunit S [Escherichia coli]MBB9971388.1 restriction endonuclease subunit S [Escherichia coli]MCW3186112.1 restriction endonuclease subunit S [Escherichia coli]MCW3190716.1 restriction endonuclease subunit S [Escherichia coli]